MKLPQNYFGEFIFSESQRNFFNQGRIYWRVHCDQFVGFRSSDSLYAG